MAIIGRTNVGKSTLFNRLVGKRIAVTSEIPKTTRDRIYGSVFWQNLNFDLIDTGGFFLDSKDDLGLDIQNQADIALNSADLILFLVDGSDEITLEDREIASKIRKTEKKVFLVVNKIDNKNLEKKANEFYKLGLGEPICISALHGTGIGDLLEIITGEIKKEAKNDKETLKEQALKIAIVGRPNVGKSLLLNSLIGEKRAIVSKEPGTTRDIIDTKMYYNNIPIIFVDTAGIRRRGKIKKGIEKYSVLRSIRAILMADIVLLLIDSQEGLVKQDSHIGQYILDNKKGLILVVNKWDIIEKLKVKSEKLKIMDNYIEILKNKLPFLYWAPVIFTSALTGKNVKKIFDLILEIKEEREKRVSINKLNKIVSEAILHHPPTGKGKIHPKIYYSTQVDISPPTFVFMVNNSSGFHFSYLRYLEKVIRENFGFIGTPIKIILKRKE